MSVPELLLQQCVNVAWDFVRKHTYLFGALLSSMPVMKQERYRELVEQENVTIHFGYPVAKTILPAFSVVLLGEEEEISVVGDEGPDSRAMPYPPVAEEDYYPQEEFYGVLYGKTNAPQFSAVDGDLIRESTRHPLPRKNLDVQRAPGDEQYERLDYPQRLWHRDQQHVSARVVTDRVNIGIIVTTDNEEKTIVYHRLLRNVLRRFTGLMQVNGIQNPKFSSADVVPAEAIGPTTGGTYPFQRMTTISFLYEDRLFEIESIIRGWLIEIDLATKRPDEGVDIIPVVTITSGEDIE
jgi:hypothetical protein